MFRSLLPLCPLLTHNPCDQINYDSPCAVLALMIRFGLARGRDLAFIFNDEGYQDGRKMWEVIKYILHYRGRYSKAGPGVVNPPTFEDRFRAFYADIGLARR